MNCPNCGQRVAPIALDAEFSSVERNGRRAALGPSQFAILEALVRAHRPLYADWLGEQVGLTRPYSLHKAVWRLRRSVAPLGVTIVCHRAGLGEAGAYSLSLGAFGASAA